MKICILQGHPHGPRQGGGQHLCHALADAYAEAARGEGHELERVDIGDFDLPLLRDPAEFVAPPLPDLLSGREAFRRCDHLVVVYPLWLGTMPAAVKTFFEQLSRDQFAIKENPEGGWPIKMMSGRSARVIVTMAMPAMAYRIFFGAHGVRGFESGILGMSGFKPVRETLFGGVHAASDAEKARWFATVRALGRRGQ